MTYSLSHADVRAIQAVLDECGELWSDAPAWQEHVARRAEELVGGNCGLLLLMEPEPIAGPLRAIDVRASTPSSSFASKVIRSYAEMGPNPPRALAVRHLVNETGRCCVSFADLMPKHEFVSSAFFEKYMAPLGAADALNAVCGGRSTPLLQLSVCRPAGDPVFGDRERCVLAILADAIDSRVEQQLSTSRQRGLHDLDPRQKQVLRLLLAGDSQKQVAYKLGISAPAVHDHITNLHRYFDVHSRGELLAYFIHRRPATKVPNAKRMPHSGAADRDSGAQSCELPRAVTLSFAISNAEHRVLALMERGLTNAEIGRILGRSPNTVRNTLASAFRKLDVTRRSEAVYQLRTCRVR